MSLFALADPVLFVSKYKFPSCIVVSAGVPKVLSVAKLLEGVSKRASLTTRLFGVKSLPWPDLSLPRVTAVAEELSEKSNLTPFVP